MQLGTLIQFLQRDLMVARTATVLKLINGRHRGQPTACLPVAALHTVVVVAPTIHVVPYSSVAAMEICKTILCVGEPQNVGMFCEHGRLRLRFLRSCP